MYRVNRSRSLAKLKDRLGDSFAIDVAINQLLTKRRSLDVLEVGFGYGHTLLELAWLFRDKKVRFHGVDKRPNVESREDLRRIAVDFALIPPSEIAGFKLPVIHAYDATTLHFEDESLDFIYSAFVVRFIERKDKFLEAICRVLKPGGGAVIHIGGANWNYSYGPTIDGRRLTDLMNRFVLKYRDELIPLPAYLELFEGATFRFDFAESSHCILVISKLASGSLRLCLDYDKLLSMPGRTLPLVSRKGVKKGGFRSVYELRDEYYAQLSDRGLLTAEPVKQTARHR